LLRATDKDTKEPPLSVWPSGGWVGPRLRLLGDRLARWSISGSVTSSDVFGNSRSVPATLGVASKGADWGKDGRNQGG
jgi:hypothetical protein